MATLNQPVPLASRPARGRVAGYPLGGVRFDLTVALLATWFMIGLFIDGWAHNHGRTDETFFTPWHALLYSGIGAVGVFLSYTQYRNVSRGYAWSRALPKGYLLSLVGVVLFFVGGGFDFLWHEWFGFEASLEALLSPAHLILAVSGILMLTGPLRAQWARAKAETPATWAAMFPAVLALLLLLSLFTFFSQYANLFTMGYVLTVTPDSNPYFWDVAGIAYVIFTAMLTMGVLLFALRRWALPFGAVTFIVAVNTLMMFMEQYEEMSPFAPVLLSGVVAGLAGDVILARFRPSLAHPFGFRLFGFAVPFLLTGVTLGVLIMGSGIFWTIHMWLGATVTAAAIGVGVSYLVFPPAVPVE